MKARKTVASVSFHDNHSLSLDIEQVLGIEMGTPIELEEGQWFCEVIVRSHNGNLSVQMIAENPERFRVEVPQPSMGE